MAVSAKAEGGYDTAWSLGASACPAAAAEATKGQGLGTVGGRKLDAALMQHRNRAVPKVYWWVWNARGADQGRGWMRSSWDRSPSAFSYVLAWALTSKV